MRWLYAAAQTRSGACSRYGPGASTLAIFGRTRALCLHVCASIRLSQSARSYYRQTTMATTTATTSCEAHTPISASNTLTQRVLRKLKAHTACMEKLRHVPCHDCPSPCTMFCEYGTYGICQLPQFEPHYDTFIAIIEDNDKLELALASTARFLSVHEVQLIRSTHSQARARKFLVTLSIKPTQAHIEFCLALMMENLLPDEIMRIMARMLNSDLLKIAHRRTTKFKQACAHVAMLSSSCSTNLFIARSVLAAREAKQRDDKGEFSFEDTAPKDVATIIPALLPGEELEPKDELPEGVPICHMCSTRKSVIVALPCGHNQFCASCCHDWVAHNLCPKHVPCPTCRRPVIEFKRVFR